MKQIESVKFAIMSTDPLVVGDYLLTNQETQGGYVNYTATDKQGNRYQAIAVLTKTISKSYFLNNFRNMFEILSRVSHPSIQKIVSFTVQNEVFYVFLETSQVSAFTPINDGQSLTELEAGKIFVSLIDALALLHDANIAHLDIRPENLLLINGEYKLTNFFMSQVVDTDTLITKYGTPNYQAPEIFQETGTRNPRAADIWAAGLTLFALLTGKVMFTSYAKQQKDKFEEIRNKIKTQSKFIQQVPDIFSPELRDLLELMLQQAPQNRITINDIQKHPWVDKVKIEMKRMMRIKNISLTDYERRLSTMTSSTFEIVIDLPVELAKEKILELCDNMSCHVINLSSTSFNVKMNEPRALFSIKLKNQNFTPTYVTLNRLFCEDLTFWDRFASNFRETSFNY